MTMQFQGFKPQALERIAGTMGFSGDMEKFGGYLEENPEAKQRMDVYNKKAIDMMNGGMVRRNYAHGGPVEEHSNVPQIKKDTIDRMNAPALPTAGAVTATGTVATDEQFITPGVGQLNTIDPRVDLTKAVGAETAAVEDVTATTYTADKSADKVKESTEGVKTVVGELSEGAKAKAAFKDPTTTDVKTLEAEQGEAILIDNPVQRKIEDGEVVDELEIEGQAARASAFTEEIEAATASPTDKATVKGQLDILMDDFEGGATPAWSAGAMRVATAQMAARGLGASSMAGMAIVQAAMEAALPIATADANTQSTFQQLNLSNRQARAIQSAKQRAIFLGQEYDQKMEARVLNAATISDIADKNFDATQTIALEHSRVANTMAIQNLTNKQALVLAEAAAISSLETQNLSNEQAAASQRADAFLKIDMTNINNEQQTELFKSKAQIDAILSDTAQENAAKQFNASSDTQTKQYMAGARQRADEFKVSQKNAIEQTNVSEENKAKMFNAEVANQRDQYNASNALVIAQSDAVWRREIATAATAAINRANEVNATNILELSNQAYANLWAEHGDLMEWAWTGADNERDRQKDITLSHLAAGRERSQAEYAADLESSNAIGDFVGTLALGYATNFLPGLKSIL